MKNQSYSGWPMKFNRSKGFNFSGYTKSTKSCNIPVKGPIKWLPWIQIFFSIFQLWVDFWKNSVFEKWVTLNQMKIFEWNFQQSFLIKSLEKLIQNGWAWTPFHAYHNHFSKTLIFQKWPWKPNKSWKNFWMLLF